MPDRWEIVRDGSGKPLLTGVLAIHAALLPSKRVIIFSGSEHDEKHHRNFRSAIWDPDPQHRQSVRCMDAPTMDLFCCGHCMLPNGNVFVAGGTANYDREKDNPHRPYHFTGINDCFEFDWRTERWLAVPSMRRRRWYPTCVTLDDGRVLAISGHDGPNEPDHEVVETEIFDPAVRQWQLRPTVPPLEDTGMFRLLFMTQRPMVYYTRLHGLRDGRLFSSTALQEVGGRRRTRALDPGTNALTDLGPPPPGMRPWWMPHVYSRANFTSALLPLTPPDYPERILIAGGREAYLFEARHPERSWRRGGSKRPYRMRAYATSVVLPDGSIVVIGGGFSEKMPRWYWPWSEHGGYDRHANPVAEHYLPARDAWVEGDRPTYSPIARMYHTVALLLPDGTVWVAGSNHDSQRNHGGTRPDHGHHGHDARELRMEIYSPPYLFERGSDGTVREARRPEITVPTDQAGYGERIVLTSRDANAIHRVTMARCASVTHAYSSDQRLIELVIDPASRGDHELAVTTPPEPTIGIPGYYLLFALGPTGTPSHGHMIQLG
jgi:Domain of unknown function (DUF1929)